MLNRKNKKGFTLAELLIVVAIIAVLVAIAVPLFVGALNDAEDRVVEANEHSVKSMAVTTILTNATYSAHVGEITTWVCNATVNADGSITLNALGAKTADECKHTSDSKLAAVTADPTTGSVKNSNGTFSITVEITKSDLTITAKE